MSLKHKKRANIKLDNKDESKIDVKYFFLTSIHNYHSATETHLFHVLPFKVEANDKLRRRCNYLCLLGPADFSYLIGIIFSTTCFFRNISAMGCILFVLAVCLVIPSIHGFCFSSFGRVDVTGKKKISFFSYSHPSIIILTKILGIFFFTWVQKNLWKIANHFNHRKNKYFDIVDIRVT